MVSQVCDQCGAEVAADEQFCPSCGSFIDPLKQAVAPVQRPRTAHQRRSGNVISVSSDGPYEEFTLNEPIAEEPPAVASKAATAPPGDTSVECPSCGTPNPANNLHCQNCGARLRQGPLPTAPRPAVQATAGVRAALAISGLLLIVILVALGFNLFSGASTASSTTVPASTSTTVPVAENAPIPILRVDCDPPGLGTFACPNLTNGVGTEYQLDWEELEAAEGEIKIRLSFSQPMIVGRIDWTNIGDQDRFLQNHRAMGITIDADNQVTSFSTNLEDTPGTQLIQYAAINANYVEITIHSTYRSQVVGDQTFPEIAVDEIVVLGRPAGTAEG